ncbi:glycosyltransferase family 4 protein [Arthrobacter sp. TWP1-1]|uniref:glycosyltransferase family 4 protein n=1 Tax=Arthrobacter sp. TWP1-1 TaxID=2804568 RepID=UPI003CFB1B39
MNSILLVATEYAPFAGGIGRYGSELVHAAGKLGWDVRVVAPTHGIAVSDAQVTRFNTPQNFEPFAMFRAIRAVRSSFKAQKASVIHATDYRALVISRIALPLTNPSRFVVTCHGTDVKGAGALKNLLQRIFFRGCRLIANSAYTASLVRSRLGRDVDMVTPLGVRPEEFHTDQSKAECKEALDLNPNEPVILCVARFERRKAQDVVVDAMAMLPLNVAAQVQLVFVGPGNDAYFQRVSTSAANSRVRIKFMGKVSDEALATAYGAADVFCLLGREDPRRVEGFGLVYLEAASRAIPVVAARVDAIPAVVLDGITGILVEPDNPTETADALTLLLTDNDQRQQMGLNALSWANRCTWEKTAQLTYGRRRLQDQD